MLNVDVVCLCRGTGRTYMELLIRPEHTGDRIAFTVTAEDVAAPHTFVPLTETADDPEPGAFRGVLLLPLVGRQLTVTVTERTPEGETVGTWRWDGTPSQIKWLSRINYRLNKQETALIRDIELTGVNRTGSLVLVRAVPLVDATLFHFEYSAPYSLAEEGVSVRILDAALHPVDVRVRLIGNSEVQLKDRAGTTMTTLTYAVILPGDGVGYTVTAEDSRTSDPAFVTTTAPLRGQLVGEYLEWIQPCNADPDYPEWRKKHVPTAAQCRVLASTRLPYEPVFSIVCPVFNTPLDVLDQTVQSVRNQCYPHWQLVLANASPENEALSAHLKRYTEDPRIEVVTLAENRGISLNTAEAIQHSTGEFVGFLDHDDLLESHALFSYAEALNESDSIDVLYCDEDKLYPDGTNGDPFFKPDFSLHYLRENNYICHFLMVRRSLLSQIAPADRVFDGAQDHRMILQLADLTDRFCHVPRILYQWRILEGSTAAATDAKPYATIAGKLAVEEHLKRRGIDAEVVETQFPCRYHVHYPVQGRPLVSIVIPNKDAAPVLETCVRSILERSTYDAYEVVVVENNSTEPETFRLYEELQRDPRVHVVTWDPEGRGFNYSAINNFGAAEAQGDFLLFLNNDTKVRTPDWIQSMLGLCQDENVGAVGAKLFYPDTTIQHAGVMVGGDGARHLNLALAPQDVGYFDTVNSTRELSACTAACLMVRRDIFESVGGFTEELAVAFNDIDLCCKIRETGQLVIYDSEAELTHYESLSRGLDAAIDERCRFFQETMLLRQRWPKYYLLGDPYFNVNLDANDSHYKLGVPDLWRQSGFLTRLP